MQVCAVVSHYQPIFFTCSSYTNMFQRKQNHLRSNFSLQNAKKGKFSLNGCVCETVKTLLIITCYINSIKGTHSKCFVSMGDTA